MIKLSERMLAIANMVTPGLRIADIGCDHGYLPIYLVENQIAPSAVAMDVRKGPLCAAKEHIHMENLENVITTRLSDGLTNLLEDEGQSVIIAGMGGQLVLKIVEEGRKFWPQIQEFILQPQSELALFRKTMEEYGFSCVDENMVFEDGKYYPMGRYVRRNEKKSAYSEELYDIIADEDVADEVAWEYGTQLLIMKHPVLLSYLQKEEKQFTNIVEGLDSMQNGEAKEKRLRELEHKARLNHLAQQFFD